MAKLFRRGKIWHAYVRRRGGGVKRVSTLCTSLRAAEVVLAQLEREAVDPAYAAANKATTQQILDNYYASRKRLGRAEGSLHHVRVKAGQLLRLMPKRAAEASHAASERYIDERLKDVVRRTTIKKELRVWKATLKLAKQNGLWAGDPDAVVPQLDDDYEPGTRVLTPLEMVALAGVLSPRRMAFVAFSVATGCDPSAIFRATAADVAADASTVCIHGTKRRTRERVVPLPFEGQRALVRWALARTPAKGPLFSPWANVRRDLHKACAKLGVPGCSPNDLRRTYGTWLREAGVEPTLIGAAMGHADSRMVERVYGRLTPDALAKLVEERVGSVHLVCAPSVDSPQLAASGAEPGEAVDASKQHETAGLDGAQAQDRTGDTGIFSPPAKTRTAAVLPVDGELTVGARALSVRSSDGALGKRCHPTEAAPITARDEGLTETSEAVPQDRHDTSLPARGSGETGANALGGASRAPTSPPAEVWSGVISPAGGYPEEPALLRSDGGGQSIPAAASMGLSPAEAPKEPASTCSGGCSGCGYVPGSAWATCDACFRVRVMLGAIGDGIRQAHAAVYGGRADRASCVVTEGGL